MTDSDNPVVRQILAEIGKHGGTSGVTFRQRPTAVARYPTDAILAAVRLLAEQAEAAGSPMAAGLRGVLFDADTEHLGHCFAADPLIQLADLPIAGCLAPGDPVLVVGTGPGAA